MTKEKLNIYKIKTGSVVEYVAHFSKPKAITMYEFVYCGDIDDVDSIKVLNDKELKETSISDDDGSNTITMAEWLEVNNSPGYVGFEE